ncbi:MAG: phenylalanine--tRNA ligase beta subunit-related protein [Desulfobacterota bacterium]|nr:phenylalanine--tRNA ligase beta subunit-related protein [Thermodesulfobacteriota bacterium]
MRFSIQQELFDLLPDLTIGMVVAVDLHSPKDPGEIDRFLGQVIEALRKGFVSEKAQDHPRIKPWRAALSKVGISGSKFPSSIESMVRRILKGDPFPKINPLVDLYNALSLKHLVPMGGHDLDTVKGNIHLRFAEGWEPFTPMGGGETIIVPKGELVYRDDEEVLTRNWVWRQCEKDKVTERTKKIFIPIDLLGEVGDKAMAEAIIGDLSERISHSFGGRLFSTVLNREHPSQEFFF